MARRQIVAQVEEQIERPEFWADRIATNDYRGHTPGEALETRGASERPTSAGVRDAFCRYWKPEPRFTIRINPELPAAPRAAPGEGAHIGS